MNRTEILEFLQTNKGYITSHFNIIKIGLFGSFSKNEQTEKSDIDIVVEFASGTTDLFDKKYDLNEFLKSKLNRNIDLCREGAINPLFKSVILKETIYV